MSIAARPKVTAPAVRARKHPAPPLIALTAYDHPTAEALDAAGVDILLVGDSLGMVVLGHPTTLPVTMEVMLHHTAAVARARPRALLVADMPFLSYHVSREEAVRNAGRLIQEAGAEAVKIEGGRARAGIVRAIADAEIPVMGHVGLTPQSFHTMGGFRVQGRGPEAIQSLIEDVRSLEEAGAFAVVLEGMPAETARLITRSCSIPTIGIGAGPHCDGQILVVHDLLGLGRGPVPKFARRYTDLRAATIEAVGQWARDVSAGRFPSEAECYDDRQPADAPRQAPAGAPRR